MTAALPLPAVLVLVGPPASGKTRLRRRLIGAGLDPELAVGLDDLRREARGRALAAGEPVRRLQDYSYTAVRAAAQRQQILLDAGTGYLSDATNLRRRERVAHIRAAAAAGVPAVALLLPDLSLAELLARDATRPPAERVPADVVAAFAHRRSLLDADLLRTEGFAAVYDVDDRTEFRVAVPRT
jgi:predicted kinase